MRRLRVSAGRREKFFEKAGAGGGEVKKDREGEEKER